MNINKVASTPVFESKMKINKGVTAAMTGIISAAALYADSKREGVNTQEVINEYYKNEFELRNRQHQIKFPSRFSNEEKLEFLQKGQDLKVYSKAFFRIVNAKDENNSARFNGEECLKLFDYVVSEIQDYPEIFATILSVKDDKNKPFYNADDCVNLMKKAQLFSDNKDMFKQIVNMKFEARDVINIIKETGCFIKEDPVIFDEVMKGLSANENAEFDAQELIDKIQKRMSEIQKRRKKIIQNNAPLPTNKQESRHQLYFEKIRNAVELKQPLVLETGEVVSDTMREAIASNLKQTLSKAASIVDLKYDNGLPIFNERECYEIISELPKYKNISDKAFITTTNDGTPIFVPEQCKEILTFSVGGYSYFDYSKIKEAVRCHTFQDSNEIMTQLRTMENKYLARINAQNQLIQQRKEEELEKAEEKKILQAELQKREEMVGWISSDKIFNKLRTASKQGTLYVLQNGQYLSKEYQDNVFNNYKNYMNKAKSIIDLRYANKTPVFSEQECLDIINELDLYRNASVLPGLKKLDENNNPFFSPEQCKALLKITFKERQQKMAELLSDSKHQYTAEEIVQHLQDEQKKYDMKIEKQRQDVLKEEETKLKFIDNLIDATNNNHPFVLSTGEVISDEMRDQIAYHIKATPYKANCIINAKYKNKEAIFSEKECCEILSQLDSYSSVNSLSVIRKVDENGSPFFTPQQCKELLRLNSPNTRYIIDKYLQTHSYNFRKFTPDEIVEISKNTDVTYSAYSPFHKYLVETDDKGMFKYTVAECIEKTKNDYANV